MHRWLLMASIALLATGALPLIACGEEDEEIDPDIALQTAFAVETQVAIEQAFPTPGASATAAPQQAVSEQVDELLQALRGDPQLLRDLLLDRLQQQLSEEQVQQLAECIPEGRNVRVVNQVVDIQGMRATVELELGFGEDGQEERAQVTAIFERANGEFRLAETPQCPFGE